MLKLIVSISICCSLFSWRVNADISSPRRLQPVSGEDEEYPIHAYGAFDVYAVCPTYDDSLKIQTGNQNPWVKIKPKKSWEIGNNFLGLTPTRSPSSHVSGIEPHSPLKIIDGDPHTKGFVGRPDGDPSITRAWVRIDFPRSVRISSVALAGGPSNFEIRVFDWDLWPSKSGRNSQTEQGKWRTVCKVTGHETQPITKPNNTAPAVYQKGEQTSPSGATYSIYQFDPVEAREVWLTSDDDFFLAECEVRNVSGSNLAKFSRGCGITVSAQYHLLWLDQETQASFWRMQYDLGIKWLRLSYYLTPFIWTFVERQKGIYTLDPYLDDLVSEAVNNGIEVTLTLGPPDNSLYMGEEDQIAGFSRYAEFMVNHFKGRIRYYEIYNEFYNQDSYGPGKQGPVDDAASNYVRRALPAAKAIKQADPDAKICLCGPCPLVADFILTALRRGMAEWVDVITWHPYSFPQDTDDDYAPEELDRPRHVWAPATVKNYADAVEYLRNEAGKIGFHGELWANECGAYAIHNNRTSTLIAAKYLARSAVLHTFLRVPMFWNETTSLFSPPWQPFWGNGAPILKPTYSYYVLRTLATLLDGTSPDEIRVEVSPGIPNLHQCGFSLPGNQKLIAIWMVEKSRKKRTDELSPLERQVTLNVTKPKRIIGVDLLNGREQEMTFTDGENNVILPSVLLRDYPLLFRLE